MLTEDDCPSCGTDIEFDTGVEGEVWCPECGAHLIVEEDGMDAWLEEAT